MGNAESAIKDIKDGVGGVGQSVGDLFYPGNPNRRARVDQLKNDISVMRTDFELVKKNIQVTVDKLEVRINQLLKERGFDSVDDMDAKLAAGLDSKALMEWNIFKQRQAAGLMTDHASSLNRDIKIENLVFAVGGMLTIATGVISYGLAICGAITFASAGTAIEVTGMVALGLAAAMAILAAVNASEERDKLRAAIRDLAVARVNAKQSLEQLRIYEAFVDRLLVFLNKFQSDPEEFDDLVGSTLKQRLQAITKVKTVQFLKDLDKNRSGGAWIEEDPPYAMLIAGRDTVAELIVQLDSAQAGVAAKSKEGLRSITASARVAMEEQAQAVMKSSSLAPDNIAIAPEPKDELQGTRMPIIQVHDVKSPDSEPREHHFRLVQLHTFSSCTVADVLTGEPWDLRAELDLDHKQGLLPKAIGLAEVPFTLSNAANGEVLKHCTLSLVGFR